MNKIAAEPDNTSSAFYPNHLFMEAIVAVVVVLALALLSLIWQVPLEEIADPGDTTYVPRPEWYFLFYFQLLKYFEGPLIIVGTFFLPVIVLGILFVLPFIDKGEESRMAKRPVAVVAGCASVLVIAALTMASFVEDAKIRMNLPPVTEQELVAGKDIFNRYCVLCHTMEGKGGFMAPDLTQVGSRVNRVYIERVVLEPGIVSKTTIMSVIPLSDEERHSVSAYLSRKK